MWRVGCSDGKDGSAPLGSAKMRLWRAGRSERVRRVVIEREGMGARNVLS